MVKHLIKILWAQRRLNGWIFCELAVVICVVWLMVDKMWVDTRCYMAPLGYDIENTWRLRLAMLSPGMDGYMESGSSETMTDDFHTLVDRIGKEPEVEGTCLSFWSMPYSFGNSWRSFIPIDGDTAKASGQSYHTLAITPDYFTLFRIRDVEGREIPPMLDGILRPAVMTAEGEDFFFGGKNAKGSKLSGNSDLSEPYTVAAVLPTFRSNDFDRPENCLFTPLDEAGINELLIHYGVENVELCVRMRERMSEDEMLAFLERIANRFVEGNIFVQSVESISVMRDTQLSFKRNSMKQMIATVMFLLTNIFFGIVGTFWLRTERRRGEIGLRMAIGSSRGKVASFMSVEGMLLLLLTFPILLIFIFNMAYLDRLDSYREPLSMMRTFATIAISYIIMAGMIGIGILIPVSRAINMNPSEALRYE